MFYLNKIKQNSIVYFCIKTLIVLFSTLINLNGLAQNIKLKAWLMDNDSFTRISFAIVSIKGKTIATSTDERGYFEIECSAKDTIIIRHISYELSKIQVKKIIDTTQKKIFIYLSKKENTISQVTISGNKLSKEKKEEYKKHLERTKPNLNSPISLLYEGLSRKGKERSKMDEIYEQLLLRDEIEQRIPPRKLYLITNDRSVKIDDLLIICPVSEEFVKKASEYDFFYHFSKCWERYKKNN